MQDEKLTDERKLRKAMYVNCCDRVEELNTRVDALLTRIDGLYKKDLEQLSAIHKLEKALFLFHQQVYFLELQLHTQSYDPKIEE
jgi:hypothetical protein